MAMDIVDEQQLKLKGQQQVIEHQGNYIEKLVMHRDKVRGLVREYDCGEMTADMLVSYLKLYV